MLGRSERWEGSARSGQTADRPTSGPGRCRGRAAPPARGSGLGSFLTHERQNPPTTLGSGTCLALPSQPASPPRWESEPADGETGGPREGPLGVARATAPGAREVGWGQSQGRAGGGKGTGPQCRHPRGGFLSRAVGLATTSAFPLAARFQNLVLQKLPASYSSRPVCFQQVLPPRGRKPSAISADGS